MRAAYRLLLAGLIAAAASPAFATDDAAAWNAAQRAIAAQQALSDRYTVIWSTLNPAQKARFGAQERAWLNEGRDREQHACIARASQTTELAARTCEAEVIERHLGGLPAPQRVAAN